MSYIPVRIQKRCNKALYYAKFDASYHTKLQHDNHQESQQRPPSDSFSVAEYSLVEAQSGNGIWVCNKLLYIMYNDKFFEVTI